MRLAILPDALQRSQDRLHIFWCSHPSQSSHCHFSRNSVKRLSAAFFGSTTFQQLLIFFCHLSLQLSAPYVMTDHNFTSAFTNLILRYFLIPLSFQIVSSSMVVSFLALPILALVSSEKLPVFVLMAPLYFKEFTSSIVYPSTSIDALAFSPSTTTSLVFRAFNLRCPKCISMKGNNYYHKRELQINILCLTFLAEVCRKV